MKTKTIISRGAFVVALAAASQSAWAAPAPAPAPDEPQVASGEEIIVTGTRTTGLRASDSPAPIQLLGSDAIKRVGQPDLNSVLAQQLPSIQVQAFGSDQTAMHPSIKLRGLSPNHTLIEINGKRRHGTSNVNVAGGPYGGGAAPDLSLIPQDAIDHIEVLQDGAAAQYGTDAIAGVVNFILKKNPGFTVDATGGKYIGQGGGRYDFQVRVGAQPIENLNVSIVGERSFKDYSFRGDVDPRVANTNIAGVVTLLNAYPGIRQYPNYPYVNRIVGDGRMRLTNGLANMDYQVTPEVNVYAFGTYSHKVGRTYQNYRLPNVVVGKSTVGVAAGAGDVPFPGGFSPQELTRETDYAVTGGVKGEIMDTTYDLSTTWGKDVNNVYVDRSANAALYFDSSTPTSKGFSPSLFFDGAFVFSQWDTTLDLTHKFNVGLANPLNVAGGLEYRQENYILRAGDPASYYISPYATTVVNGTTVNAKQGGAQSFFGYSPANASNNSRKNYSEYLDFNIKPVDAWLVDAAVRHENYSDFGSTTVFKLTSRYDFSPNIAIRGTVSTGFRAPTLAEAFYSGINVGPTSLSGIFAPNSAGARALGLNGLKPEKSTNFSAGLVVHPAPRLTVTVDGYYIQIRDRIVQSGSFFGANYNRGVPVAGTPTSSSVLDALRAAGVPVDAVLSTLQAGAVNGQSGSITLQTFVNGLKTRTTGIDFLANYSSDFGTLGHVDWSLSANYNKTKILSINAPPANVNQASLLLDPSAQSNLIDTTPKFRATAGAYWTWNKIFVSVRESFYGKSSLLAADPTSGLYVDRLPDKTHFITDLEVGINLTKYLKLSGGANNIFDVYPTKLPDYYRNQQYANNSTGYITKYPSWSPIGINGGYYYGRLSLNF
ncbi:TonB-dependent receptor plug domain-containing protein [Sphingomonas bacterium]|uniref:TonB-dependent receptor plug domain-containing protein n=1 Tax=Sphingomonas bacterium TaxID=1895847 RepID=UPI001575794A|nr:TonB-dependent receptor [Sphingomonas bacterium]